MKEKANGYIVIGLLLLFAFATGVMFEIKHPENPRLNNGIDSIFTDDSTYIIRFTIDSVYENTDAEEGSEVETFRNY
jgi:hypothetical protein